jgi:hypothetical protein
MFSSTPFVANYKTLASVAIVSAFLVGLAGCGGGGADTATVPTNPQIASTPTSMPANTISNTPANTSTPVSSTTSVNTMPTTGSPALPSVTNTVTPTAITANTPTPATATVTNAPVTTCNDPQASLPSRGTATHELVYEADGRNGNTLVTIQEFSQGLVNPNEASFGDGPYYGLLTVSAKTPVVDGLGISPLIDGIPFVSYYQLSNNRLGLIGYKSLSSQRGRTLATTLYTPVFYNPMFSLTTGQSVTHTVTSSISAMGSVPLLQSKTERIEFVGIESYVAGTTNYSVCKYITTDLSDGKTTTVWYWLGKDVLLQSVVQENDSLGNKVLVERRILKRAALNSAIYFTRA